MQVNFEKLFTTTFRKNIYLRLLLVQQLLNNQVPSRKHKTFQLNKSWRELRNSKTLHQSLLFVILVHFFSYNLSHQRKNVVITKQKLLFYDRKKLSSWLLQHFTSSFSFKRWSYKAWNPRPSHYHHQTWHHCKHILHKCWRRHAKIFLIKIFSGGHKPALNSLIFSSRNVQRRASLVL